MNSVWGERLECPSRRVIELLRVESIFSHTVERTICTSARFYRQTLIENTRSNTFLTSDKIFYETAGLFPDSDIFKENFKRLLLATLLSLNESASVDQSHSRGPHLKIPSLPEVQLKSRGVVAERSRNRNTKGGHIVHLKVALRERQIIR